MKMKMKFLQELPTQLFEENMNKLLMLNIWECESLRTLPAELGSLTSLRTLSIDDCRLLNALPAELRRLRYLTDLIVVAIAVGARRRRGAPSTVHCEGELFGPFAW